MYPRNKLFKWKVINLRTCILCDASDESENHLWFECGYIKEVVEVVFNWLGIHHRFGDVRSWMTWFRDDTRHASLIFQSKLLGFVALVYFTWKSRNMALFRNVLWTPKECACLVIRECRERIISKGTSRNRIERNWCQFLERH